MADKPDSPFKIGDAVDVVGGLHVGEHGTVVTYPGVDFSPRSFWVDTAASEGPRLIPADNLAHQNAMGAP